MNLPQTKIRNAADGIRENPEILKAIAKKTIKIFGPPGTGKNA
jgi:AAA+ superfamily predicted ATPase